MKKLIFISFIIHSFATPVYADWFFRGTANGWSTTAMENVSTNLYQTCQSFAQGDNNGAPRFKIDRFGDWQESYPTSDQAVNADTHYLIEFNSDTKAISTTPVNTCTSNEFSQVFESLNFRGTPNNWSTTAMNLVADNTWQVTINFDGQSNQRFKFDVTGDWSHNYGDNNDDNILEQTGNDIQTSVNGEYLVEVNDSSLTYSLTPSNPLPDDDQWYFRGTPNNWGTTLMASTDNINFCVQQSFNNGDGGGAPRFKIDHFADWTESYPSQDYQVSANQTYDICFNKNDKSINVEVVDGIDTLPPEVTANPAAGSYVNDQLITLSVADNQDANPRVYFTLDNTTPTITSSLYEGQTISATDNGNGVDLVIKTLSIDESNNQQQQSFSYFIGEQSSTGDFREETIYFLLTARFYDGDSNNNYYNRDRIKPGDPQWRGDFKGLIEKLDYIQDLGFTAIWVTPPIENRSGLDYHGYHAYDWNKIDPRLESVDASYQDFINQAHARGLKVIQDVVINHSSQYGVRDKVWIDHLPIKYYVPAGGAQGEVSNDPYFGNLGDYQSEFRDDNDNSVAPQWFRDRHNSDAEGIVPLVDPKTGQTVPLAGYDANRFFGIDPQTLDGNWYHLDGFMAGGDWENPESLFNKHLAGDTIDFATENQNVKDYLNDAIKTYLDMGVDAIRLDTAKHIERNELLSYTQDWQAHKPGLFVFGEVLVKGLGFGSELGNDNGPAQIRPWWYTRTGNDPTNPRGNSNLSVLDFPLFSTFRDNVTRGSFGGIKGALDMDWTYADPTQLVTFFQNHDVGPDNDFKYRYCCDQANAALAYNLLWTIRGIPTLYYGEEIMFQAGTPQDIAGAEDTIDTTGRAYFGPHLDNLSATQSHALYQHIKRLNLIRRSIPALQKGPMSSVNEWGSGMSFVREFESSYVVVGLAASSQQNISVSGVKNGIYRDAVTGVSINVANGNLNFSVNAYSAGIYVLDGPGKIGNDGTYLN